LAYETKLTGATLSATSLLLLANIVLRFPISNWRRIILAGIVISSLTVLILPILIVFLFRFGMAAGYFKPPWPAPSRASTMTPLSAVHLGSFVCIAVGVGATISIVWRGTEVVYYALLGFSAGLAFHLALVKLMRRFPPHQVCPEEKREE